MAIAGASQPSLWIRRDDDGIWIIHQLNRPADLNANVSTAAYKLSHGDDVWIAAIDRAALSASLGCPIRSIVMKGV
jgi:hypothetical protein